MSKWMLEENTFTPGEIPINYAIWGPKLNVGRTTQTQHTGSYLLILFNLTLHLSWTHPNHTTWALSLPTPERYSTSKLSRGKTLKLLVTNLNSSTVEHFAKALNPPEILSTRYTSLPTHLPYQSKRTQLPITPKFTEETSKKCQKCEDSTWSLQTQRNLVSCLRRRQNPENIGQPKTPQRSRQRRNQIAPRFRESCHNPAILMTNHESTLGSANTKQ